MSVTACSDCGSSPSTHEHAVFWTCSQTIGKRAVEWLSCNRCMWKRGQQDAVEMRELEKAKVA